MGRPVRRWQYVLFAAVMAVGLGMMVQAFWEDRDAIGQVPRAASVGDRTPELAGFRLEDDIGEDEGGDAGPGSAAESFTESSKAEWVREDRNVTLTYRRYGMKISRHDAGSGGDRASADLEDDKPPDPSRQADVPGLGDEAYECIASHPASSDGASAHVLVRVQNVVIHVQYSWLAPATSEKTALEAARAIATAAITRLEAGPG